jgi:site-specific DNA recombinase
MRAIGYFRIEADTMQAVSPYLADQEAAFRYLCQEREYQTAITFVEVDPPGEVSSAEYQRMLDYIRMQGETLLVVVKSVAHINPDPQEAVHCLLELEGLEAKVLLTDEASADPLEVALQTWSAQRQGEEKGQRVKEAMRMRAIKGRGLGKPPFGYRVGADKKLEIVPQEAATVVLIYQLYLQENMGFRLITRYLNERGIATRRGGRWSIVGIRDVLRNRVYLGTYSRFGIRIPESHAAIIPTHVFSQVQEKLRAKPKPQGYGQRSHFLLSGLVYCGSCGNRMIGGSRRESWIRRKDKGRSEAEYRYYQCQSRTNQSVCQYHTRRAPDLESQVMETLHKLDSMEVLERWLELHLPSEDRTSELPQLKGRLVALERKFRGNLDQATGGAISLDKLRDVGGELIRERGILKQRLALLNAEARGELTEKECRELFLSRLRGIREQWEAMTILTRKALLQGVINRVVVYDDRIETLIRV